MTPFDAAITFCYVPDLDAASGFYGDVLGLPLVLDQGGCRLYRNDAGAYFTNITAGSGLSGYPYLNGRAWGAGPAGPDGRCMGA